MTFPDPRAHHYLFAHTIFVDRVFKSPERVWERLSSDRAQELLAELWADAAEMVDPSERLDTPTFGVTARPGPTDDRQTLIIHLPAAQHVSECHALALVFKVAATRFLFLKGKPDLRLFVLERGFDPPEGGDRAYVAEYRAGRERTRMNDVDGLGDEPFLAAIAGAFQDA